MVVLLLFVLSFGVSMFELDFKGKVGRDSFEGAMCVSMSEGG